MTASAAVVWIAPRAGDAIDAPRVRANLLGAAYAACSSLQLGVTRTFEGGPYELEAVLDAARAAGALVLPDTEAVLPDIAEAAALLSSAQAEGWRLLLLDFGADSAASTASTIADYFTRLALVSPPASPSPIPPTELRRRVAAGGREVFWRSGTVHVECFARALEHSGCDLSQANDVLEWGAGPGRMTTALLTLIPHATITAVDPDARAIGWLERNLPVRGVAVDNEPPMPLPDAKFDVVIGHSVFSHLDAAVQDRWLGELARVTAPGAHVAVSVNGPIALRWHLEHPLVDVPAQLEGAVEQDGIAVWGEDGWENEFPDGYHTTFHDPQYVREHWDAFFDVLGIVPGAALPTQDIVVLRAR